MTAKSTTIGIKPTSYLQVGTNSQNFVTGEIIEETPVALYINAQEWVTLMCTPVNLDDLILGFLLAEGIITSMADVELLDITHKGAVVDVWLRHQVSLPQRRTLTSGCVGGMTFTELTLPQSDPSTNDNSTTDVHQKDSRLFTRKQVFNLMRQLQEAAILYPRSQGVHTSALSDGETLLMVREDVGRHNTLDKVRGACFQQNIPTANNILLTTGRISSEMLQKTAAMDVPIVISRTSPTSLSVKMAELQGITLVGYVRGHRMRVYTKTWRLSSDDGMKF